MTTPDLRAAERALTAATLADDVESVLASATPDTADALRALAHAYRGSLATAGVDLDDPEQAAIAAAVLVAVSHLSSHLDRALALSGALAATGTAYREATR